MMTTAKTNTNTNASYSPSKKGRTSKMGGALQRSTPQGVKDTEGNEALTGNGLEDGLLGRILVSRRRRRRKRRSGLPQGTPQGSSWGGTPPPRGLSPRELEGGGGGGGGGAGEAGAGGRRAPLLRQDHGAKDSSARHSLLDISFTPQSRPYLYALSVHVFPTRGTHPILSAPHGDAFPRITAIDLVVHSGPGPGYTARLGTLSLSLSRLGQ